jgi:hypothetical protein
MRTLAIIFPAFILAFASGCSLSNPGTAHVTIAMPGAKLNSQIRAQKRAAQAKQKVALRGHAYQPAAQPSAGPSSFPTGSGNNDGPLIPSSLDDFVCVGVNVVAPDIGDSAPGNLSACSASQPGPGLLVGLVPATGGTIDIPNVPTGTGRTFQLIGVMSQDGSCPDVNVPGQDSQNRMSDGYLIGSTTADVEADITVTIHEAFDPANPVPSICGSQGQGSTIIAFASGPNQVEAGACTPYVLVNITDSGTLAGPTPGLIVHLAASDADGSPASGGFFADAACGSPVSSVDFSLSAQQLVYFKDPTSETVQLVPEVSGHDTVGLVVTVSGQFLGIVGPIAAVPGTCQLYEVLSVDSQGNPVPVTKGNVAVTLSDGGAGGTFYADITEEGGTCVGPLSQSTVTIPSEGINAIVYYQSGPPSTVNLSASAPGFTTGGEQVSFPDPSSFTTGQAYQLVLTSPNTAVTGSPFSVQLRVADRFGEATTVTDQVALGAFIDPGCALLTPDVSLPLSLTTAAGVATASVSASVPQIVYLQATTNGGVPIPMSACVPVIVSPGGSPPLALAPSGPVPGGFTAAWNSDAGDFEVDVYDIPTNSGGPCSAAQGLADAGHHCIDDVNLTITGGVPPYQFNGTSGDCNAGVYNIGGANNATGIQIVVSQFGTGTGNCSGVVTDSASNSVAIVVNDNGPAPQLALEVSGTLPSGYSFGREPETNDYAVKVYDVDGNVGCNGFGGPDTNSNCANDVTVAISGGVPPYSFSGTSGSCLAGVYNLNPPNDAGQIQITVSQFGTGGGVCTGGISDSAGNNINLVVNDLGAQPAGPAQLVVTGIAAQSLAGTCQSFNVEAQDANGNPVFLGSDLTDITLTNGGSSLGFFSDSNCTDPIGSTTIFSGESDRQVFFKDPVVEVTTISLGDGEPTPAVTSNPVGVTTYATQIVLSVPENQPAGTCVPVTATAYAAGGGTSTAGADITLSTNGGSAHFYVLSDCTAEESEFFIEPGSSTGTYYMLDSQSNDSFTVVVGTDAGVLGSSASVTVASNEPPVLALLGPPGTPAGVGDWQCAPFIVQAQDGSSNAVVADPANPVTVDLSTTSNSGQYATFSDSSCQTPISTTTILAGQTSGNFYAGYQQPFSPNPPTVSDNPVTINPSVSAWHNTSFFGWTGDANSALTVISGPGYTASPFVAGALPPISLGFTCNHFVVASVVFDGSQQQLNPNGDSVGILQTSANAQIFTDSGCTVALTDEDVLSIPASGVADIYIKDGVPETFTLEFGSGDAAPGAAVLSSEYLPTGLAFRNNWYVLAGCQPLSVWLYAGNNSWLQAPNDITVGVTASGSALLYQDPQCTTPTSTTTIHQNSSVADTYFIKDTVAETVSLGASASNLIAASDSKQSRVFSTLGGIYQYQGGHTAHGYGVVADGSGGFYVAGSGTDSGGHLHWLALHETGGSWLTPLEDYVIAAGEDAEAQAVTVDQSGNIYVVGYATDAGGMRHWLVHTSSDHGSTWSEFDGHVGSGHDAAAYAVSANGSYVAVAGWQSDGANKHWAVDLWNGASWNVNLDYIQLAGGQDAAATSIAWVDANEMLVGGYGVDGAGQQFALSRLISTSGPETQVDQFNFPGLLTQFSALAFANVGQYAGGGGTVLEVGQGDTSGANGLFVRATQPHGAPFNALQNVAFLPANDVALNGAVFDPDNQYFHFGGWLQGNDTTLHWASFIDLGTFVDGNDYVVQEDDFQASGGSEAMIHGMTQFGGGGVAAVGDCYIGANPYVCLRGN